MGRVSVMLLIVFFIPFNLFGQEFSEAQMAEKIRELERRVALLEKLILSGPVLTTEPPKSQMPTDKVSWRKLRVGMKDDDVRMLLGEPAQITRYSAGRYIWRYSNEMSSGDVTFDGKGVSSWDEPN